MKTKALPSIARRLLFVAALVSATASAADDSPVVFSGKDLRGWRQPTGSWTAAGGVALSPADPKKFVISPGQGVLVNGPEGRAPDLVSEATFGDVEVHAEFCIASNSNSGVYLTGNYEVQIYDSYGVVKDKYPGLECGGIYPRWINEKNVEGHTPRVNASKPAGEWQTFDIVFRAPRFNNAGIKTANAKFVKVTHNGQVIHENIELTGPTRGGLSEPERTAGPLRLQGDHGPVAYRNVRIKPLRLD